MDVAAVILTMFCGNLLEAAGKNWTNGNVRDLKRLIVTTMEDVPYDIFSPEEIDSKADEYISAWKEKDSCECNGKCESCSKE